MLDQLPTSQFMGWAPLDRNNRASSQYYIGLGMETSTNPPPPALK